MFDSRLKSTIVALYLIQGLNYLVSFVTFPFLARTLGADGFGVMNYAFAAIQYGVLVTDFGFNLSAVRDLAQVRDDRDAAARVFWKVTWAKTLLMLASSLVLLVLTFALGSWREHWGVFAASQLYILSSVLFPIWYFQGYEKMQLASGMMVVARAATLGFLLVFVDGPEDVVLAVLLQATPQVLAGLFWCVSGWGVAPPPWLRVSPRELYQALRASWPFFLSAISTSLYTTSTAVLLGFFAAPAQVGLFAAANKLVYIAQGLIGPLVQATYPRIAQLVAHDQPAALALIRRAWRLQGGAGLAMTLGLIVCTPLLIWVLGSSYAQADAVMILLAPVILLGALSYVYGQQTLLVFGHERYFSRVLVLAGLLNVALMLLVLAPWALPAQAGGAEWFPGAANRAALCVLLVEGFIVGAFWLRARRIYAEIGS
ncbi:flippase [Chitinilyticum piscinae]|uniref:Flippase n=1 Tax=Chitinilyticum piscinae TaxID=2866724 RepID=A0A8J7K1U7_9NEIS|nr:flippase [Chitinilyticum piscinae]MBE9609112.1 flippase [Chitinilyticum piscinae]